MRKKFFCALVFLHIATHYGVAQGNSTSFAELTFPKNARIAALASSDITTPSLEVVSLNPAVLAKISHSTLLLTTSRWIQETSTYGAAIALPTFYGTMAINVWTARVPDIEIRTIPGPPEGTFSYHSSFVGASYAAPLSENWAVGLSGKYLFNKVYVHEFDGYSIDGGILYRFNDFDIALSVNDLGSVDGISQTNKLPTTIRIGGSYRLPLYIFETTFWGGVSSEMVTHRTRVHSAVEANYNHDVFIRIGYVSGYDSHTFSFGCGVAYSQILLDYAFVPFSYSLGNAHILSIHIGLN